MYIKFRTKLLYLLFSGHGEALQAAGHVTQALLKGCHKVSLQTHRETQIQSSASVTVIFVFPQANYKDWILNGRTCKCKMLFYCLENNEKCKNSISQNCHLSPIYKSLFMLNDIFF